MALYTICEVICLAGLIGVVVYIRGGAATSVQEPLEWMLPVGALFLLAAAGAAGRKLARRHLPHGWRGVTDIRVHQRAPGGGFGGGDGGCGAAGGGGC